MKDLLPTRAPESPEPWEDIMSDVESIIMPGVTHWQSPRFLAYFPANSSFPGIFGEMLSSMFNVIGFSWICSPALTELETVVMDWLGNALGLPEEFLSDGEGGGVIQGTASESGLVAVIAARERTLKSLMALGMDRNVAYSKLVGYISHSGHAMYKKAFRIAGIPFNRVRILRHEEFNSTRLQEVLEQDHSDGLIPFFIGTTIGTTTSTAMDDLHLIGLVAETSGTWLHVDAAYGGAACICPEYRHFMKGIEFADSFCFNPHKWLLVNFDCSAFWVKRRWYLMEALTISEEYLKNTYTESGLVVDYKDWQIPLGRRFRSLKLWFVLRTYGIVGLQQHIRNHCALAKEFETLVNSDERFELTAPTNLALVCFRLKAPLDRVNQVNLELERVINHEDRSIFMTHSALNDLVTLRVSFSSPLSVLRHAVEAWEVIQRCSRDSRVMGLF